MSAFETVIGLEVHVQLATQTKLFSAATCRFGEAPNTQVDAVCGGLPGSLPVLNERAVELAVRAALAAGCTVHERSRFDRKHYFYPDSPRNYQISQYDQPYCTGGGFTIDRPDGSTHFLELTRIHLEDDAGKLVHQEHGPYSEVDLNRAGTPLIEIVSEPCLRSAAEAYAYLMELKRTMKWAGVSDCEMQEGSLRCDANVSIRPVGASTFGTKVEIKNLNSFRNVEAAITFEVERQTALTLAGRAAEIVQETRLWDPDAKVTRTMRGKEGAADYRYFPDPDLPPLVVDAAMLERIRKELPELPRARASRFATELGINPVVAVELTQERAVADYVEALIAQGCPAKAAANWTREEALRLVEERKLPIDQAAPPAILAEIIKLVEASKVARVVAKAECSAIITGNESPTAYFTSRGMIQEQDEGALKAWVAQVISTETAAVADLQAGNQKALGRIVGAVMKLSGGKADPKAVPAAVKAQLGI